MGAISTVFLDRDGTINRRLVGEWVRTRQQMEILPGVGEALASLTRAGIGMYIISNQRGIEIGRLTQAELEDVNRSMLAELSAAGAKIAGAYYCLTGSGPRCKPEPGMLIDAKIEHPEIDLARSVMIGDDVRDVLAGARAGCRTILLAPASDRPAMLAEALEAGVRVDRCAIDLPEAVGIVLGINEGRARW